MLFTATDVGSTSLANVTRTVLLTGTFAVPFAGATAVTGN